jgi:hypothetical protein
MSELLLDRDKTGYAGGSLGNKIATQGVGNYCARPSYNLLRYIKLEVRIRLRISLEL